MAGTSYGTPHETIASLYARCTRWLPTARKVNSLAAILLVSSSQLPFLGSWSSGIPSTRTQDSLSWSVLNRWAKHGYFAVATSQPGLPSVQSRLNFWSSLHRAVSAVTDKLVTIGGTADVVLISGLFDLPQFIAEAKIPAALLIPY